VMRGSGVFLVVFWMVAKSVVHTGTRILHSSEKNQEKPPQRLDGADEYVYYGQKEVS
jgi:hypothetical protein